MARIKFRGCFRVVCYHVCVRDLSEKPVLESSLQSTFCISPSAVYLLIHLISSLVQMARTELSVFVQ